MHFKYISGNNPINESVNFCINLLIADNENYFDDFNFENEDDFSISFNESIIWDIRDCLHKRFNKMDYQDYMNLFSFIDKNIDYILHTEKAEFMRVFKIQVKNLYKEDNGDSTPLYLYQY